MGYNYSGSISNCYSTGLVDGNSVVGGLVGISYLGTISNCYSTGDVGGGNSSYAGGLLGVSHGCNVSNCYSTGNVTGEYKPGGLVGQQTFDASIVNCYSTGIVTGGSYPGGLVGASAGGLIRHSYFLITSGPDNGPGTPLTEKQMKQQVSFIGWDFIEIWDIGENQTCPFLRTYLPSDINKDKETNFYDLAILASHWLEGE